MIRSGLHFRLLTANYMEALLGLLLPEEQRPEFVICGVGSRSDQDDIDTGLFLELGHGVIVGREPGDLLPFLKGLTLFFWATATWWIPLLVVMGIWRHLYKHFPLRYDPGYWSLVFPLGMYTVCTFQLSKALELPFLIPLPRYFVYIALAAWLVTFIGLILHLLINLVPPAERQA